MSLDLSKFFVIMFDFTSVSTVPVAGPLSRVIMCVAHINDLVVESRLLYIVSLYFVVKTRQYNFALKPYPRLEYHVCLSVVSTGGGVS